MMQQGQHPPGTIGEAFERFTGFPSPEKVLVELQRLNANLERLAPDLHRIATSMEDVKGLSQQASKLGEVARLLQQFYTRIWGH